MSTRQQSRSAPVTVVCERAPSPWLRGDEEQSVIIDSTCGVHVGDVRTLLHEDVNQTVLPDNPNSPQQTQRLIT